MIRAGCGPRRNPRSSIRGRIVFSAGPRAQLRREYHSSQDAIVSKDSGGEAGGTSQFASQPLPGLLQALCFPPSLSLDCFKPCFPPSLSLDCYKPCQRAGLCPAHCGRQGMCCRRGDLRGHCSPLQRGEFSRATCQPALAPPALAVVTVGGCSQKRKRDTVLLAREEVGRRIRLPPSLPPDFSLRVFSPHTPVPLPSPTPSFPVTPQHYLGLYLGRISDCISYVYLMSDSVFCFFVQKDVRRR